MPDLDMSAERGRSRRSGPSDQIEISRIDRESLPGMMEAGQGGGRADWGTMVRRANSLSGPAQRAMLEKALDAAKDALASDDDAEASRAADAVSQISARLGMPASGAPNPITNSIPEWGRIEEVAVSPDEYAILRRFMYDKVSTWNGDAAGLVGVVEKEFLARIKRRSFGTLSQIISEALVAEAEFDIQTNGVAEKTEWIKRSQEPDEKGKGPDSYALFKRNFADIAKMTLGGEVDDFLTGSVADQPFRYAVRERDEYEYREVDSFKNEFNRGAKLLMERIMDGSLNMWEVKSSRDIDMRVRDLGLDTVIGRMVWKYAEACGWQVESKFSHPAARLVRYSGFRKWRFAVNFPVPQGKRCLQEYQADHKSTWGLSDYHQLSDEAKNGFDRGVRKLAYSTLEWMPGAQAAILAGNYIDFLRQFKRENPDISPQVRFVEGVADAIQAYDLLSKLGGGGDVGDISDGLIRDIRIALDKVHRRMLGEPYMPEGNAKDAVGDTAKGLTGGEMVEVIKDALWGNSALNLETTKVFSFGQLYSLFYRITMEYDPMKGYGLYVGYGQNRETSRRMASDFINWFIKFWDTNVRIYSDKTGNVFAKVFESLPPYLKRKADIPALMTSGAEIGAFKPREWSGVLARGKWFL